MESAGMRPCSSRKPPHNPGPTDSQLCGDVQTEKYTSSDGGTSDSVEHITCVNLQKHVKKEETVDEEYFSTPVSVGHITPVDLQNHVEKEEPEDKDDLYAGTSNSVEDVDQNNGEYERKHVKKEESEDEDNLHTRRDWGANMSMWYHQTVASKKFAEPPQRDSDGNVEDIDECRMTWAIQVEQFTEMCKPEQTHSLQLLHSPLMKRKCSTSLLNSMAFQIKKYKIYRLCQSVPLAAECMQHEINNSFCCLMVQLKSWIWNVLL